MAFPCTGRQEVLNVAKFLAWYFPWDDAIDDAAMEQQPADIIRYRDDTVDVVKESLLTNLEQPSKIHSDPAIQSFWDIGATVRASGTPESNRRFAYELCRFVASSTESQIVRKSTEPVTVAQYLERRENNIGIRPLLELIYYANKIQIAAQWRWENNAQMREMWKEITWMITMCNDLLSLRRELIHGQYESLVPLLMYHEGLNPQAAVNRVTEMMHESYERFHRLEARLYELVDLAELENVKTYVHSFKDVVMCNLHWSYGLKRYMDPHMLQEDGKVVFDIQTPVGM
ncbi:MAG: hypothetical protein Q9195_005931 [Heterodermia aff. obscurata]